MPAPFRKLIVLAAIGLLVGVGGWTYYQSLVPAIHPDHDHGLENIAGGGFLRVERAEGGTRNLVGRPGRVLVLHWFELGSPGAVSELPSLVDYSMQVAGDKDIEIVLIAMGKKRQEVLAWAQAHGVPTPSLYVDPESRTAGLIGVRRSPETLIYDPEGRLAHQARGPMDWSDPAVRAQVAGLGAGEHSH